MNFVIRIYRKDSNYNVEAFVLIAYALFFGAGTYGMKAIAIGLGLNALQSLASFAVYLGWFFLLGRTLLKNLHILGYYL